MEKLLLHAQVSIKEIRLPYRPVLKQHRNYFKQPQSVVMQELDLKVRQFESLLRQPLRLKDLPNVNLLWARLMVEELCRLGINTFCIAPGW